MRFSEEVQSRGLSVASMGVVSDGDYESAAVVAWTRVLSASSDLIGMRDKPRPSGRGRIARTA
jgi:hypothetical protein